MEKAVVKADLLCVGGGIAGLMAAIRASELGARVVVADKGNTVRSGCGATGNDHFGCYIPEVHGADIKPIVGGLLNSSLGRMRGRAFVRAWMEMSFDIVKLWDDWGIPMRYKGKYEFAGHGLPGRPLLGLKYSGQNQKPILTREALKRGARIMNRVMVCDLFPVDGTFVATGIDTRKERMITFHAKSVLLGTGLCTRLFSGPTPGSMFNLAYSPANTGDGRAMAYRAGAELANLELTRRWAGPKYFARCGKGSWVGVLREPSGKPVGPFVTKPDKRYGDMTADIWTILFEDYEKQGKGPVYMDCGGISQDDFDYMIHWMRNEGNAALLDHLGEEGVDIRERPVEFTTYEMILAGGVHYNEKGETSLPGLYAAGDESFGGASCAAALGWISGENATRHAKIVQDPGSERLEGKVEGRGQLVRELRGRKTGPTWQEANIALQQIMYDYAGSPRYESSLEAGSNHLKRLRRKVYSTMKAANQHELVRCLEVLNLIDLGELLFTTAKERRETRGGHVRTDYPFTNPLLNKLLIIKNKEGNPVTEWRSVGP